MTNWREFMQAMRDRIYGPKPSDMVPGETVEAMPGLNAWHTYENPANGDRIRIYNGSPRSMPLEMIVKGEVWAHITPFSGEPADPNSLKTGDYLFRQLDKREREVLVAIRIKEAKKAHRGQSYAMKSDHELKALYHREIAKECAVVQLV